MKKTSLKNYLMNELMKRGFLSLNEVHDIAKRLEKKESNAERRLRPSESPWAKPVLNEKNYIIGYKWIGESILKDKYSPYTKPTQIVSEEVLYRLFN